MFQLFGSAEAPTFDEQRLDHTDRAKHIRARRDAYDKTGSDRFRSDPGSSLHVAEYGYLSLTSVYSASTTFSSSPLRPPCCCPPGAAPPGPAALSPPWPCWVCAYITSPSFCAAVASAVAFASRASLSASFCFRSSSASFTA